MRRSPHSPKGTGHPTSCRPNPKTGPVSKIDIDVLGKIGLLAGLSPAELEQLGERGRLHRLRENAVFMQRGEESSTLYLILSGRVKVYTESASGAEEILSVREAGEHLGELALLADSRRTASAATLEPTECLVLTRRVFLECLGRNPQLALNLDLSLEERVLASDLEPGAALRYRAWAAFRRSGLPLVILIGGCTGTGKSTVAAELALRLDIGRTQSTDILREVVRLFVSEQFAPEVHVSSFEAWRAMACPRTEGAAALPGVIRGLRMQADKLSATIEEVIQRSVKERASTILEGIHLLPGFHRRLPEGESVVVPVLLTVPEPEELKRHFSRRGQLAPSRDAGRYLEEFDAIWQVQEHLVQEAKAYAVPVIPNRDLERTMHTILACIGKRLEERFIGGMSQ